MSRLQARVAGVAGMQLYLQPTQDLTIDAETGPTQYRFSIEGSDTKTVNDAAQKLTAALQDVPRVRNVVTDAGAQGPAAYVDLDRDTAARLSITASSLDDALYSTFGQLIVSPIFTPTTQSHVLPKATPHLPSKTQ